MGRVNDKKKIDDNRTKDSHFSMNIGIAASITLMACIILDYIKLIFAKEFIYLNWSLGFVVLIAFFIILKFDLCDKVKNKANLRKAIDICTAISVLLFGIEHTVLEFVKDTDGKIEIGIYIGMLFVLGLGIFIWTLLGKRDRHYNVD